MRIVDDWKSAEWWAMNRLLILKLGSSARDRRKVATMVWADK